jgi:hypothetical protein
MARVQMLLSVTGGRGDGSEWPPAGGFLVCGDDEAAALVRGDMARWPADGADGAEAAADGLAGAPAGDETPDGENDSQGGEDPSQPRVRDPKETWEMHAVTVHGVTPDLAAAMTKADLIGKFGSPQG